MAVQQINSTQTRVQAGALGIQAALQARTAWMPSQDDEPLRSVGMVVRIAEGREIFAEGDETDVFYKVISGVVRVCKFLSDGRRQIEAFHVEGDIFGFELGDERLLSAEAVSDCTLVSYRRRSVESLAEKDEGVSRHLFQYAMQNLARAQGHSLLLGRRGAAEKVASFLLTWAEHSRDKQVAHLAMTRQDIADYLGLTIETVSRSLSQFERDGMIALTNIREVRLKNVEALEDLAA
ncbi:MAG TPA: helix-turn-helix domain-containing protein [Rhizomicrobium sp.]|nr:helix-turn-helix domain-containing protein [Rhizomicrobium sp.]